VAGPPAPPGTFLGPGGPVPSRAEPAFARTNSAGLSPAASAAAAIKAPLGERSPLPTAGPLGPAEPFVPAFLLGLGRSVEEVSACVQAPGEHRPVTVPAPVLSQHACNKVRKGRSQNAGCGKEREHLPRRGKGLGSAAVSKVSFLKEYNRHRV